MLGLGAYGSDSDSEQEQENVADREEPSSEDGSSAAGPQPVYILNDHDVISSEPDDMCSAELQKTFEDYFRRKENEGYNFVQNLHENRSFGNPALVDLEIRKLNINENGTNFPKSIWNPQEFKEQVMISLHLHAYFRTQLTLGLDICRKKKPFSVTC